MKRVWIPLLIVTLVSSLIIGCGQGGGSDAGNADAQSMLELLPREATGVFFVDVQKAMAVPVTKRALAENPAKLDEFIAETGIDPTTDVSSLAGAVITQTSGDETGVVVVMSVKVDAEALVARIEKKRGELAREDYQGVTIYALPPTDDEEDAYFAFLDEGTVALGTALEVRAVIDVHQKRTDSIRKNIELMAVVENTNQEAILWAAFVFTEEEMEDLTGDDPMMSNLNGVQSVRMSFDYEDMMLMALIEGQGRSEEKNQQIADFLIGIKSFASMGAAEKPEVGELIRTIEITSSPENIRVSADIPEELLQRLDPSEES